jgi:hypothetical protein
MSEEYSVGYSEGYQAGWNAAMDATPPAAPVQEPIGYAVPTFDFDNSVIKKVHYAGTVPLYTTPPAAQPAVPDALNPKDENPAYAAGWNDCRAEMLKGMKP